MLQSRFTPINNLNVHVKVQYYINEWLLFIIYYYNIIIIYLKKYLINIETIKIKNKLAIFFQKL